MFCQTFDTPVSSDAHRSLTITRACHTDGRKYLTTRFDGASARMYGICAE